VVFFVVSKDRAEESEKSLFDLAMVIILRFRQAASDAPDSKTYPTRRHHVSNRWTMAADFHRPWPSARDGAPLFTLTVEMVAEIMKGKIREAAGSRRSMPDAREMVGGERLARGVC